MPVTWIDVSDELLEESRALNAQIEALLDSMPSTHTIPAEVTRRTRAEGKGVFGELPKLPGFENRTLPGGVRVRTFVPERVDGAYLHIHGGGWTLGAADQQDTGLAALATAANVAIVSVDYRLAPEHPHPAGDDDCEAAALWFVENARAEFGTDRWVIGGESAGAHLAAVTLLRLRDKHDVSGFAGANLVFGAFDLGQTPSQRRWGNRNLILSRPIMDWFFDNYLPGLSSEDRRDPATSPLWADLSNLPPALFTVGAVDPLLDDSLFMGARWEAAGNEAEVLVYPESIHGFHAFPTGIARMAATTQHEFVARVVKG